MLSGVHFILFCGTSHVIHMKENARIEKMNVLGENWVKVNGGKIYEKHENKERERIFVVIFYANWDKFIWNQICNY